MRRRGRLVGAALRLFARIVAALSRPGGAVKDRSVKGARPKSKGKARPQAGSPRMKAGARHQVGALPLRVGADGALEVLLVTSRDTRRWVIPKGWPMKRLKDRDAAAREAREEAGIAGRIGRVPLGSYRYWKRGPTRSDLCRVEVYQLDVKRQLPRWKEQGQRETRWFSPEEAARLVDEPDLAALIAGFGAGTEPEPGPAGAAIPPEADAAPG